MESLYFSPTLCLNLGFNIPIGMENYVWTMAASKKRSSKAVELDEDKDGLHLLRTIPKPSLPSLALWKGEHPKRMPAM